MTSPVVQVALEESGVMEQNIGGPAPFSPLGKNSGSRAAEPREDLVVWVSIHIGSYDISSKGFKA